MIRWMIWAFVMTGGLAVGAPIDVRVTLEPPRVPFHRIAVFTITAEGAADAAITIAALPKIDGLEVTAQEPLHETLEDGRRRVRQSYVLDAVRTGAYLVPSIEVAAGEGRRVATAPVVLEVRDLTDEEKEQMAQFHPSASPEDFLPRPPLGWPSQLVLAAAVLLVIAAVAIGLVRYRRRNQATAAPPLPAWEVARQRLRALAARQLPEAGKHEAYYVDLTAILRYYIEDRFHLRAPEQTTPEFLESASSSGLFTEEQQDALAKFLRHCDRVKFALYKPTYQEMANGFALVARFVDDTVPRPEEAQGRAAA